MVTFVSNFPLQSISAAEKINVKKKREKLEKRMYNQQNESYNIHIITIKYFTNAVPPSEQREVNSLARTSTNVFTNSAT